MSTGEPLNPDEWTPGLKFQLKALNRKSVKRAKSHFGVVEVALQHDLRKDNEKHRHRRPIDPARTASNTVLIGPEAPTACMELVRRIFDGLGLNPKRWDAMMAVELVHQPPDGWDQPQFYEQCLVWARSQYEHIVSAVVHRDQKRPHLHIVALAIAGGRLCGAEMTQNDNRAAAQRHRFMAHMRATLGLRPDREPKVPAAPRSMAVIFTSVGKGPKTRAAADISDAELWRRADDGADLHAHQPPCPADLYARPETATSSCAALATLDQLFSAGVAAGIFAASHRECMTPAPPPVAVGAEPIRTSTDPAPAVADGNAATPSSDISTALPHPCSDSESDMARPALHSAVRPRSRIAHPRRPRPHVVKMLPLPSLWQRCQWRHRGSPGRPGSDPVQRSLQRIALRVVAPAAIDAMAAQRAPPRLRLPASSAHWPPVAACYSRVADSRTVDEETYPFRS